MSVLLVDTNIVSILFKPDHSLYQKCFGIITGHQLFISFMTWNLALVTADYRDFEHLNDLELIPVSP